MKLCRSVLATPASRWEMMVKAVASDADMVFLDLEDAVAPADKPSARENVIRAIKELDWGDKPRMYRVNGLDTQWALGDLLEIIPAVADRLDLILIPKVESAHDVRFISTLIQLIGQRDGVTNTGSSSLNQIGFHALIERPRGLIQASEVAEHPRVRALVYGPGDFAAAMGMPLTMIGLRDTWDETYGGDRFHYAHQHLLVAARAASRLAIDGPSADFRDLDGFRNLCQRSRALGYDGRWCIHPAQIPIANEVFSPSAEEITWAKRVIDALNTAAAEGRGAIQIDGKMIDVANLSLAHQTLRRADTINRRSQTRERAL